MELAEERSKLAQAKRDLQETSFELESVKARLEKKDDFI